MPRFAPPPRWRMPLLAASVLVSLVSPLQAASQSGRVAVGGDVSAAAIAQATSLGRLPRATAVSATLTLPLRDPAGLADLLQRLSDPADPQYGHFLTPEQFAARFGPTQADYDAAAAFAQSQGLSVTGTHANRLLLDVSGPAGAVETAFGVHLNRYQSADGRRFRAPDAAPSVPQALAGRISGVVGIGDAAVRRPYKMRRAEAQAQTIGSGQKGGMKPDDIKAAYGLSGTSLTGSGQTLAVFELDGYNAGDIQMYTSYYGLPSVTLQNVLLDGASGRAGDNADEVTLDIELQAALAPGAAKIIVYETTNTDQGILDAYSRIATDNQAKQISSSWGLDEPENDSAFMQSENAIFQQMAAQGQTMYAAAGDSGAYDSGVKSDGLRVDDPGSQPYVCCVGGTTLRVTGRGGGYVSETTWNAGSVANGAGGGGVSSVWPIPTWQTGVVTSAAKSSATMRNVPDVALNADTNTGYSVYVTGTAGVAGGWTVYGGCSCSAPLWAGFTALVNQQRANQGKAPLGQVNPALYALAAGTRYAQDFHDIADNSTNLYYPAVSGYDDATGLGSFMGSALLADLAAVTTWTAQSVSVGSDGNTRALWDKSDGTAAVWKLDASGNVLANVQYGPYAGWTARAVSTGGDNQTRLLWTNTSGQAAVWLLDGGNAYVSQQNYGPYSGWTAQTLATGANNQTALLWNHTSGQADVFTLGAGASYTQQLYGPFAPWKAKSLAVNPDGTVRLLWTHPSGQADIYGFSVTSGNYTQQLYGPYTGWTAGSIAAAPDGTGRLAWVNADAHISLWTLDGSNAYTGQQSQYGPFSGWSFQALSVGGDGNTRLLWDNISGQAALWSLTPSGSLTSNYSFGPF